MGEIMEYNLLDDVTPAELAEENDAGALFETGVRLYNSGNPEAKKYFIFAMRLGANAACKALGDMLAEEGDIIGALEAYHEGRRGGEKSEECAYAYAALTLEDGDEESMDIILSSANDGNPESMRLLENYYHTLGNKKESAYWANKIPK